MARQYWMRNHWRRCSTLCSSWATRINCPSARLAVMASLLLFIRCLEHRSLFVQIAISINSSYTRQTKSSIPCRSTLGDLNWLGNQKTGRFAVLLCGSSASCPLLVTLDASKEEFPLQKHSPHLNGTKYKTRRLSANPFLDMEVSKQMLRHFLKKCTEAEGKLITFCVGTNPRKFSTLAQSIEEEADMFSAFHYGNHAAIKIFNFIEQLSEKVEDHKQKVLQIWLQEMKLTYTYISHYHNLIIKLALTESVIIFFLASKIISIWLQVSSANNLMIFALVYFSFQYSIFASNSDFFEYTQESHVFEKAGTRDIYYVYPYRPDPPPWTPHMYLE